MGQKVNPFGFRLGITNNWKSIWYEEKEYANNLLEDIKIKSYLQKVLNDEKEASVSSIIIERFPEKLNIIIHTARPAMIIGKKGNEVELLITEVKKITKKEVNIKIEQIKRPEANAQLIARNIAVQLKKQTSFKRAMKHAITNAIRSGAKGVKILLAGRLGGAEIARMQELKEGRVPLHTLRADIDYGVAESLTTFGKIGIKVWVFNGEVLGDNEQQEEDQPAPRRRPPRRQFHGASER